MGLSARASPRVDAATKQSLIGLVDGAETGGWSTRSAFSYLELSQRRLERWRHRVADGISLDDETPGGDAVHGITPADEDEIIAGSNEWFMNWRGQPVTDIRTIAELIAVTTTTSGLRVHAAYD